MRHVLLPFAIGAVLGLLACTEGELVPGDDDGGGPPFDLDALACEHDFVNERLGGVHYWLLDLQADGHFEQGFPNTPADRVVGTYDRDTGALSATVTYDDGYKAVEELVEGTVVFQVDGDSEAELTGTTTYLDGFVEIAERASTVAACQRVTTMSTVDRGGEAVAGTIATTFTGPMTAEETIDATIGDDVEVAYDSLLHEDYSRDDDLVYEDLTTAPSPDQVLERTMLGDGSGTGSYVRQREDGGTQEGTLTYLANGDQHGPWEIHIPDAPYDPFAWGETTNYLDGSGETDYVRLTLQGEEVTCHGEWGADGHGYTECDDGSYEEY